MLMRASPISAHYYTPITFMPNRNQLHVTASRASYSMAGSTFQAFTRPGATASILRGARAMAGAEYVLHLMQIASLRSHDDAQPACGRSARRPDQDHSKPYKSNLSVAYLIHMKFRLAHAVPCVRRIVQSATEL